MKNNDFAPKVMFSFICLIIITLVFLKLTYTFSSEINARNNEIHEEFDIFNGLDLDTYTNYGTFVYLDDKIIIKVREIYDHKYNKEPTSFDLSNAKVFTSKEVVEFNPQTNSNSVYIVYEKVKLKNIEKLLDNTTNIKFWITEDNMCENMIIELK